ncbi:MAG TPA: ribosome maturation factor RimM [Solirubrobacteraceae bacterium]|nr:ribosome maturation factor RimM [Solirubrobacteraceae bacterium]
MTATPSEDRPDPRPPAGEAQAGSSVAVGRVGRAHGLDGSFYVTQPVSRLLLAGAPVTLAGRTAAIVRRAGTEQRPIVRVEGVGDRAAAEALRGAELTVARERAPRLEPDEWWAHELEGCAVWDGARLLGTVSRLLELPSCEALEVRPPDRGEPVLVPMVKDAVRAISAAERRIEVDLEFLGLAEHGPGGEGEDTGRQGPGGEGA